MNSFGLFGMSPRERSRMRRLERDVQDVRELLKSEQFHRTALVTEKNMLVDQRDDARQEFEKCKEYLVSSEEARMSVERRASGLEMSDDAARSAITLLKKAEDDLVQELFEFGDHKPGCAILKPHTLFQVLGQSEPPEPPKCDCGWQAVHDARLRQRGEGFAGRPD